MTKHITATNFQQCTRRDWIKHSATGLVALLGHKLSSSLEHREKKSSTFFSTPSSHAKDEHYWNQVAEQFDVDKSFVNLENGYYGVMPRVVQENYFQNLIRVNRLNSRLLRTTYKEEEETIRIQLAGLLNVLPQEIALTRGGTEALQNLIGGYNRLQPGDKILYADLDYFSCQYAFHWLKRTENVELIQINIPEPIDKKSLIETYVQAWDAHPRIKLMLLSHINNRTGLVTPVQELVSLARERGIDVIVDSAHAWGHLDFDLSNLHADFVGLSLHKWINAPLGLGCLYIQKNRLPDISRCFDDELFSSDDIRSRAHSGTINIATRLTLPVALQFHLQIGALQKQNRLRYLRDLWVSEFVNNNKIQILTPQETDMYGAITSFRITKRTSTSENDAIVKYLFDKHGIFTVRRSGVALGDCIRVTPALFTGIQDIEKFIFALRDVISMFG